MEGESRGETMKDTIVQGLQQAYLNLFHMIAEFLPRLVVMLVIILSGLLVAYALKYMVRAVLRLTKLDRLSEEAGASRVLRMAALPSMTEVLSRSVFWITLLGFILVGISILNIAGLQEQVSRLLRLLPEIFVAMLILSIQFGIWILAIAMALDELGVARQTVIAAFSIVFGAFMLGLAIAFGLGGQGLARAFLERSLGEKKDDKADELQPL